VAEPLISVVIPAFSREREIPEAVQSLQQQAHGDWEALIVDDGSTDGTLRVAQRLAAEDHRVRVLFHPHRMNLGPGASRNLGVKVARGEVITFLDSDDVLEPDALSSYCEAFARFPQAPIVYGQARFEGDRDDGIVYGKGLPWVVADLFPQLVRANVIPTGGTALRREILRDAPFPPDMPCCQDWACWLQLSVDQPFVFMDRVVETMRTHRTSITGRGMATPRSRIRYRGIQADFLRRFHDTLPNERRHVVRDGLLWRSAECLLGAVFDLRHGRLKDTYYWLLSWLRVARSYDVIAGSARVALKTLARFRRGEEIPLFIQPFSSEHGNRRRIATSSEALNEQ
jgi:glycosyltransferase involved in cell wall biosynthesis